MTTLICPICCEDGETVPLSDVSIKLELCVCCAEEEAREVAA